MITNHRMDLRFKLLLRSMEAAASSFRGQSGIKDMVTNLFTGDNLRPFLIVMGLFLLYPISGLYNIAFFAVSLFQDLELGGAETVAVFTALLRCAGTLCSTLLLFRWGVELETKAIRWFAKVSIVSYSRPSLMIVASVS